MSAQFEERGGLIVVDVDSDELNEALNDSIGSLSPRGTLPALSTYWIQQTLDCISEHRAEHDGILNHVFFGDVTSAGHGSGARLSI